MMGSIAEKWTQVLFTPVVRSGGQRPEQAGKVWFQPTHECVNCERMIELDRHGRCSHCLSDAVRPA